MITEVCVNAYAKINIGLNVLPGTTDGFHQIESIFQFITLCDTLVVRTTNEKGICIVDCEGFILPQDNTIMLSYKAFCSVTGNDTCGVYVELKKRIPVGGGLGGGSSDAAALIRALEILNGISLSVDQKKNIAAKVGSDVFFFLLCDTESSAIVSGRGEVVKPIVSRRDLYMLLIFPSVKSETKNAYALLDSYFKLGKIITCPAYSQLEAVYNSPVSTWTFANSFTPCLSNQFSEISLALEDLRLATALFADMSGSGSTVYGIFASENEAKNARSVLELKWKNCCIVQPLPSK